MIQSLSSITLPPGWAATTLGDVVEGGVSQLGPQTEQFVYVDISSIDNKIKRIVDPKHLPHDQAPSRARQCLAAGDIIVSMTRPNLNAVALVPEGMAGAIGSTGFHVLRTIAAVPQFLFYLVQSHDFVEAMTRLVQGALYPAVRPKDINNFGFALPPLPEQHRIVAEIERQFSLLDAGVANLKRVQANLKRYRAAVLQAACTGQLVPTEAETAQAEGRPYEPADVLLTRILAERRARWEAEQLAKMEAQGKLPLSGAWKARYQEPAAPDTRGLPELPEGWVWATVEQMASPEPASITDGPFGSNLKTEHYTESGPRVIRLQNIGDGVFVNAYAHISVDRYDALKKHNVMPDDIVIAGMGERPPRSCIIPFGIGPAIVKADCIRVRPHYQIQPKYLNVALNSEGTRTRLSSVVHGVGRPRLNLSEIKAIVLPLPPQAEQTRVVAEVEHCLSVSDNVEQVVRDNLSRAERLRQAILKEAFAGRLVPQDAGDEPASAVLERIRLERVLHEQEKKKTVGTNQYDTNKTKVTPKRNQIESLYAVLVEANQGLSPEELFQRAGYSGDKVDDFFESLRSETTRHLIQQDRPNDTEVYLKASVHEA